MREMPITTRTAQTEDGHTLTLKYVMLVGETPDGPGELRRQDYRSGFCRQRSSPRPYDERPENQRPDRDASKQHHHPHRPHGCTGRLAVTADESRNIYGGRSILAVRRRG